MNDEQIVDQAVISSENHKPRVGVSSCLLGEKVRYNGTDKRHANIVGMSSEVEFVSICPEMAIGLGVPRPKIRLVGDKQDIKLLNEETGEDVTEKFQAWATQQITELQNLGISGYIFKARSNMICRANYHQKKQPTFFAS